MILENHIGGDDMASSLERSRANDRYKKKAYDDIKLRVPKGYRDSILRVAAEADGMSLNEYMLSTVAKRIMDEHPEIKDADKWKISLAKQ